MFKHRASSTLNRSAEFASKHMFDGTEETCWNSDQGSPQFLQFEFNSKVIVTSIKMMFQGGFVGQDATIQVGNNPSDDSMQLVTVLEEIEDSNRMQTFDIPSAVGGFVRITFPSSTDFYGRVTIYQIELHGRIQE